MKVAARFLWLLLGLTLVQALLAAPAVDHRVADIRFSGNPHAFRLGFNLGYLHFVQGPEYASLQRASQDGFRFIRVYESWRRGQAGVAAIVDSLAKLVELGFTPILCLSNFPYDEAQVRANIEARRLSLDDRHLRKLERASKFTNRFPPEDVDAYLVELNVLLQTLEQRFGSEEMQNWLFELGNEPAAPKFFWGEAGEYRHIVEHSSRLLKRRNAAYSSGFGGFSTRFVNHNPKAEPYYQVLDQLIGEAEIEFLSFHIYQDKFPGQSRLHDALASLSQRAGAKRKIITEWNPGSKRSRRTQDILDSSRFMGYLLDMAELSREFDIDLLLVHKLRDNPQRGRSGGQLGLLKADGSEKQAYAQLLSARGIFENGYHHYRSDGFRALGTAERMILQPLQEALRFDISGYRITDGSVPTDATGVIQLTETDWLILKRISPARHFKEWFRVSRHPPVEDRQA